MKHLLVFLSLLFFTGCPDTGVEPPLQTLFTLSAEEIISTEALIKINYAVSDSITVRLKRNGQTIANSLRMYKDFVFNDTLLQPKNTYTYNAFKIENGIAIDSSLPLQITTMDTTSHEFAWETATFGNGSSSVINDVAIINDTLIYAVGEIYILDSTGQNETMYNAAKWDGKKWTLLQILVRDFGTGTGYYPLYAVYAFGRNDVWFASDADLIQWDGANFSSKAFFMTTIPFNGQVRKMWGTNSSNIYCVGLNGAIYHYTGTTWQKLESGTTTHIQDVWGVINKNTKKEEIFCAVTDFFEPKERKILRITNSTNVDSISWNIGRDVVSVWTYNGITFYTCGDGIFHGRNGKWKEINFGTNFYTSKIIGNALNDIFVVGSFGLIAHFNGNNWKWFPEQFNNNIAYSSVAIQNNFVAATGFGGGKGIIIIGKRK